MASKASFLTRSPIICKISSTVVACMTPSLQNPLKHFMSTAKISLDLVTFLFNLRTFGQNSKNIKIVWLHMGHQIGPNEAPRNDFCHKKVFKNGPIGKIEL